MVLIKDIINIMNEISPEDTAQSFDNVGLLIGDGAKWVDNVAIALDCTNDVIEQATRQNAGLIITHHPIIFNPINRITADSAMGRRIISLIKNDIAVYSAHTNLDIAKRGVNDALFSALKLKDKTPFIIEGTAIGRIGRPNRVYTLKEFAKHTAGVLDTKGVSYVGESNHIIRKIAIIAGSAGKTPYIDAALLNKCDAYLTGDISYSNARYAADAELNLISAPHFAAEVLITHSLREHLTARARTLKLDVNFYIAEGQRDVFSYP